MIKRPGLIVVLLAVSMALCATARAEEKEPAVDFAAVAKAVAPSLVRVEWTLQFDKGEAPQGAWQRIESLVTEERPLEIAGYVLSPTKVVSIDPVIHPRFVKSIVVRSGEQVIEAKISAYGKDQDAVILDLAQPLTSAKPLEFTADAKDSLLTVNYTRSGAVWTIDVQPMSKGYSVTESKQEYQTAPSYRLIVTDKGQPVALHMKDRLPKDDSWKVSPLKWEVLSAEEMAAALKQIEEKCDQSILRVSLSFRSPKKVNQPGRGGGEGEDESSTERNVLGLMLDENTIAIQASLKRNITSRLERIMVYPAKGDPIPAKFSGSLTDYGCLIAKLDTPLKGAMALSTDKLTDLEGKLLFGADITLQGEKKVCYYNRSRISGCYIGWRRNVYPQANGSDNLCLLDAKGQLVALPVARRPKPGQESHYDSGGATLTAVTQLKPVMSDLAKNTDASNVPLTEQEESRLAWLGVVLQPLNKELARENNVSEETHDGSTGGFVSYVYPGSPADKAGIKPGYILLRLHFKEQPKPVEVRVEADYYNGQFPWNELDRLPEQYYDRIPCPWPSAEDMVARTITDEGFGKTYIAEFFNDGKTIKQEFKVEESPAHYESAARFKATEAGLTVRNLTYELRRYFQKTEEDPGVIISKVEPGGKASVAGIKPFEIITHIDGTPVSNVKDFETLIKKQGEVRLSVSRMTKGRQVKINLTGSETMPTSGKSASKPAGRPSSKPAASNAGAGSDIDE